MPLSSPLKPLFDSAGATQIPYGPPESPLPVPAVVSYVEAEYAAIRKHAAILDLPHRGTLAISGPERHDFLGRMVTQELRDFAPFAFRRSFWLNRKGRIDADLRLTELGDAMKADVDVFSAPGAVKTLSDFLFTEDVQIEDVSEQRHRLAVHGPAALKLLLASAAPVAGPALNELADGQACLVQIAGARVLIERQDSLAVPGLELTMDRTAAEQVWRALAAPFNAQDQRPNRARPIGWHAWNIARIESGWPFYNIDFGPTNLPHETGVLHDRVSFKKGCYLGQEVVARMESLGKPKQILVALRVDADPAETTEPAPQPATGSRILGDARDDADLIGAVTSSAISPMLGGVPICFGMVKYAFATPGTRLYVEAEGRLAPLTVQPQLRFWPQG